MSEEASDLIEKTSEEILQEMFKSIGSESVSGSETIDNSLEEVVDESNSKKKKEKKKKKKRKKKHKHRSVSKSPSRPDLDRNHENHKRKKATREIERGSEENSRRQHEIYHPGDDRLKIKSRRDSRIRESRERAHSKSKRSSRSHDEPDERSKKDDPFWESKWEAMQVQEMADKKELKGKHFLDTEKKKKRSISPVSTRESSPETSELKQINRMNEIKNLVVKADEIYVAEPPNPDLFEWDERLKMRRKKIVPADESLKDLKPSKLTQSESQNKKEKQGTKRGLNEKEDGEINSEDEERSSRNKRSRRERRSKSRSRSRDRNRQRTNNSRSSFNDHRRRRSRSRSRSRDRDRDRNRDRFRHDRRRRSGSRSKDGFRGSSSAIDKAKLLAIAQKNAVKLLNSNDLKGMNKDRLVAIKSGGQSLNELTTFCRELAKKGITDEFSDDEDSGEEHKIQHPFMVRDRPLPIPIPISLGIHGLKSQGQLLGLTLQTMTPAMRDAARSHRLSEFPVSSGNSHRQKETSPSEELEDPIPTGQSAAQKAVSHLVTTSDPLVKLLQLEDKSPLSTDPDTTASKIIDMGNPLGKALFGGTPVPILAIEMSKEAAGDASQISSGIQDVEKVFEAPSDPSLDIGDIISLRLGAMKRLSSNQSDSEALKDLYNAQQEMAKWACSKNKPGQFTGTTGAKVLSKSELMMGAPAWAKQEQFTSAKKVSGGFGEYMLRKMGWRDGDGLGREKTGTVDPLQLDIKMDKRGLMAAEEGGGRRKASEVLTLTGLKDISGKHPVSGLLELSTKKKWGAPLFTQVFECGPPHKKNYIWKVSVNGVEYQPSVPSDNKKKAKANAAMLALQLLGVIPRDPNNPL